MGSRKAGGIIRRGLKAVIAGRLLSEPFEAQGKLKLRHLVP